MKAKQLSEHNHSIKTIVRIQDKFDYELNDKSFVKLPSDERFQIFNKLQHRFNELKDEEVLHELRSDGELSRIQRLQEQ